MYFCTHICFRPYFADGRFTLQNKVALNVMSLSCFKSTVVRHMVVGWIVKILISELLVHAVTGSNSTKAMLFSLVLSKMINNDQLRSSQDTRCNFKLTCITYSCKGYSIYTIIMITKQSLYTYGLPMFHSYLQRITIN